MNAALEVELLKLRRSTAARVATVAVAVGAPGIAAGFTAVARRGGDSLMAAKVQALVVGEGWAGYLGLVAQLMSVAVLLAVGVVVCWSFGREHVDGTFGALFALPTPRHRIALAKAAVLTAWGLALTLATAVVAVLAGLLTGIGWPDGAIPGEGLLEHVVLVGAGRILVVGGLTVLLTLPLAWVASAARGYLPGIAALLGVVVVTQVVTLLGGGAWFPWAAPGMWSGMGGAELAAGVQPAQLLLAVPVGVAGALATARWWGRAEVR